MSTSSETVPKRLRRVLFDHDLKLLAQLRAMAPDGEAIPFADLTTEQMGKLAAYGGSRLTTLKIAVVNQDKATYAPVSVTIDPAKIAEYQATLDAPPKAEPTPKGKYQPKPNLLGSFFIKKLDPIGKERKAGTEAGFNYDLYQDGMSIADYMAVKYDRYLETKAGKFFNGPSFQLLYADMDPSVKNIIVTDQDGNVMTKEQIAPRAKKQAAQEAEAEAEAEQQEAAE